MTGAARERWSELPARSVFGVAPHLCSACTHGGHLVSPPLAPACQCRSPMRRTAAAAVHS